MKFGLKIGLSVLSAVLMVLPLATGDSALFGTAWPFLSIPLWGAAAWLIAPSWHGPVIGALIVPVVMLYTAGRADGNLPAVAFAGVVGIGYALLEGVGLGLGALLKPAVTAKAHPWIAGSTLMVLVIPIAVNFAAKPVWLEAGPLSLECSYGGGDHMAGICLQSARPVLVDQVELMEGNRVLCRLQGPAQLSPGVRTRYEQDGAKCALPAGSWRDIRVVASYREGPNGKPLRWVKVGL